MPTNQCLECGLNSKCVLVHCCNYGYSPPCSVFKVTKLNSLSSTEQQLKAKISQLLNDIKLDISCGNGVNEKKLCRKLEKLSAI